MTPSLELTPRVSTPLSVGVCRSEEDAGCGEKDQEQDGDRRYECSGHDRYEQDPNTNAHDILRRSGVDQRGGLGLVDRPPCRKADDCAGEQQDTR